MAVKILMFNNGLQIIGDVTNKDTTGNAVIVTKPVQLVFAPSEDPSKKGSSSLGFAPFLQYAEEWKTGVSFMVADILTVATPMVELLNGYNQTFGSGLVLPGGISPITV